MPIRRIIRSGRICSVLTYWYRGVRYRLVLRYNLTMDQERAAALQIMTAIHAHTAQQPRVVEGVFSNSNQDESDVLRICSDLPPRFQCQTAGEGWSQQIPF